MNSVPGFRFSQLSFGVARTGIRHGHTWPRRRKPQPELSRFAPGHGEQIWVYSHLTSNQIIYSHSKQLDSNRALRQLPFNGKKTKPAKLRRDYWKPMALIQLPAGAGAAGQSVFQKLREFRRLHELCWDESLRFGTRTDEATGKTKRWVRDRHERGVALNDQRANAIADMAAVLGGAGRGSRLLVSLQEKEAVLDKGQGLLGRKWTRSPWMLKAAVAGEKDATKVPAEPDVLLPVTIYWSNDDDRRFAEGWSDNVTHKVFEDTSVPPVEELSSEVIEQVVESKPLEQGLKSVEAGSVA